MPSPQLWIDVVPDAAATGRIRGPDGGIDNIMLAHGLRPHTMEGHLALYKAVLHHARNALPRWLLETTGVYVSHLNGCAYCVEHHFAYGNRTVLGLGVTTEGDTLGLSPSATEDPTDWSHR